MYKNIDFNLIFRYQMIHTLFTRPKSTNNPVKKDDKQNNHTITISRIPPEGNDILPFIQLTVKYKQRQCCLTSSNHKRADDVENCYIPSFDICGVGLHRFRKRKILLSKLHCYMDLYIFFGWQQEFWEDISGLLCLHLQ